jgi:hypothetical protein
VIVDEAVRGHVPPAWFWALPGIDRIRAFDQSQLPSPPIARLLGTRAGHVGPGDERDEGLGRMTSSPTVQRGSSVAPAWVQPRSLMARSGGQFSANSAVIQRSSNRPASEPLRVFIEGSGCCERAPRPGPLMLVDGLKIGARDHARAVTPVSAISVVAGARNHRNRLDSPSRWMLPDCLASSQLNPREPIAWELRGNGPGNFLGNWESDWPSEGPALGRA